jgi:endonuclease/exonuclease/phosphatase family metal-dependent hydrolase
MRRREVVAWNNNCGAKEFRFSASMKFRSPLPRFRPVVCGLLLLAWLIALASAETLRVVSYNIEADIDGVTTPRDGLDTILEAIGQQNVNGITQKFDILALQETTRNTTTIAPIVLDLNTYYGAGIYAMSSYQATVSRNNPGFGNGPNGLIYNTTTLQLIASVGIGTPQGATNGEYRQIVRYEFQPVGGTAANDFYVYVSHMKSSASGTTAEVQLARNREAAIMRNDVMTLSPTASVLYLGDFNLAGSAEPAYQTLTASGQGQLVDPLNVPQNNAQKWSLTAFKSIMTDSTSALRGRTDLQFMTQDVYDGTSSAGLQYIAGSYHAFGNNGTTGLNKSTDLPTNTSLNNLVGPITSAETLTALTTASDHLPVVADYLIVVPEPGILLLFGIGSGVALLAWRRRR